jgi:hypothetical protein
MEHSSVSFLRDPKVPLGVELAVVGIDLPQAPPWLFPELALSTLDSDSLQTYCAPIKRILATWSQFVRN